MTETEKSIVNLLLALTQRFYGLAENQFAMNRVLSKLPMSGVDEELRQSLRDAVARGESLHDQGQALLADVQAFAKRFGI